MERSFHFSRNIKLNGENVFRHATLEVVSVVCSFFVCIASDACTAELGLCEFSRLHTNTHTYTGDHKLQSIWRKCAVFMTA